MVQVSELNEKECAFLSGQGILPEEIFDGRGMANRQWKADAKALGFDFVLAGRCTNGGHRLKTRAGHCIQCRTSSIAFVRRENAELNVYLAMAKNGEVTKVGCAKTIYTREESLRSQGYGGLFDWEIICWVKVKFAGRVEREIAALFSDKKQREFYEKDEKMQEAIEMFSYSASQAAPKFIDYVRRELGVEPRVAKNFEIKY